MIILGIDPGIATVGYGIVKKGDEKTQKLECLDFGTIKTDPSWTMGERLKKINSELTKLIKQYKPNILAVEKVYFFKNLKTAMPVSQAKGVILFTAAKKKIPVHEFTPLQIKTAVTGYGRADKKQIKEMVKILLNLKEAPKSDDAADALGAAICYSQFFNTMGLTSI
ncbi:crossover junction endodeoxyribonuclease RuvC [Candidatus Parcubacteria bacterium]|nr:crossover junction endodeoxyribonuclease RuvC [Candidatus Parcubacteria bacterium]